MSHRAAKRNPLPHHQQRLWTEVGRIVAKLDRAAGNEKETQKLVAQLRALLVEAQKEVPAENDKLRNNPLVTLLNPRGAKTFGKHVLAIVYEHNDDGQLYAHGFGDQEVDVRQRGDQLILTNVPKRTYVRAQALPNGTVVLKREDGKPVWGEYDVDD